MRNGILLTFQNLHPDISDEDNLLGELGLAEQAEQLGFDTIWVVEHHFDDYAMCPDNFAILAYLAGRTSTIRLATGAVILPWNDPLRVAEKAVLVDYLSGGRLVLGLGRGLARMEYDGFGIDMNEARPRFDEAAAMVLGALESGVMEGPGPFYPQVKVELRPGPTRPFRDRLYAVGISPDSVHAAADIGAGLMAFVQKDMAEHGTSVDVHRERFRARHGAEPPIPVLAQPMYCHPDPEVARELAFRHIGRHLISVVKHYDFAGEHFDAIKGYQNYGEGARRIREAGMESAVATYVDQQIWGTPDQILERIARTKAIVGDFEQVVLPAFGDMAHQDIEASMRPYAEEVMPHLDVLR